MHQAYDVVRFALLPTAALAVDSSNRNSWICPKGPNLESASFEYRIPGLIDTVANENEVIIGKVWPPACINTLVNSLGVPLWRQLRESSRG